VDGEVFIRGGQGWWEVRSSWCTLASGSGPRALGKVGVSSHMPHAGSPVIACRIRQPEGDWGPGMVSEAAGDVWSRESDQGW
jgi:hypothetical protein